MKPLLLDTHVLLWWLADPDRLSADALGAIADVRRRTLISAAVYWEMSTKQSLGRLSFPNDILDTVVAQGMEPLDIRPAHALEAGTLPRHHADPFDRMLVAQAKLERLTLVTRDDTLSVYDIDILNA